MSTDHIPGFVPSMLLNSETLLSGHPLNEKTPTGGLFPFRVAYHNELCAACQTRQDVNDAYFCERCDAECTRLMNGTVADQISAAIKIADRLLPLNAPVTGSDLGAMAKELGEHYAPKPTVAEAFAAVKRASLHNVKRRPLVMKFYGEMLFVELMRRFALIGLEATSDCCGDVCVRETRGNTRLERLVLLQEEIARLRADHDDDCLQYDMDEQASGDEP